VVLAEPPSLLRPSRNVQLYLGPVQAQHALCQQSCRNQPASGSRASRIEYVAGLRLWLLHEWQRHNSTLVCTGRSEASSAPEAFACSE
jgi:hypothetical protein